LVHTTGEHRHSLLCQQSAHCGRGQAVLTGWAEYDSVSAAFVQRRFLPIKTPAVPPVPLFVPLSCLVVTEM
jgi:hypothetical protein